MNLLAQALKDICPHGTTYTGDTSVFSEESFLKLKFSGEAPTWEEVLSWEPVVEENDYNIISVGSMWDRFSVHERIFIRQSANPVIERSAGNVAPYDPIIEDLKDSLNLYSYIDLSREDLIQGVTYTCHALLNAGIIDNFEDRVGQLLEEGTEEERFKGIL